MTPHQYANGASREQQLGYNNRWRDKQKRMRSWVDDVAGALGVSRDELLTTGNARLVSDLLQHHFKDDPPET